MPRSDIFLGRIRQIGKFSNDYVKLLVQRMDFVKLCQISTQVRLLHIRLCQSGTNYVNLDLLTKSN